MQRSWAHAQVRRVYPEFVSELDMLTPEDVVWEPYSPEAVAIRAPAGLSSHCSANASLWLTSAVLVYDIAVFSCEIREVLAIFSRDLMKDKLGAIGVSGRDPADDDDDYTLE